MNCRESEQFFDAYLDGELSGSLRLEFDAHRLRCPVCQQKLAMMEACEHIVSRDSRMPALSDDFTDRVMDSIGERRIIVRRVRRRRLMLGGAVALQAAAVLVFALLWASYWKPAEPDPGAVATAKWRGDVDRAIVAGDKVELMGLIEGRVNQYAAARSNFSKDMSGLARYATHLSVLGDLSILPDTTTAPSPWGVFEQFLMPASADEEIEPPTDAKGPFSL